MGRARQEHGKYIARAWPEHGKSLAYTSTRGSKNNVLVVRSVFSPFSGRTHCRDVTVQRCCFCCAADIAGLYWRSPARATHAGSASTHMVCCAPVASPRDSSGKASSPKIGRLSTDQIIHHGNIGRLGTGNTYSQIGRLSTDELCGRSVNPACGRWPAAPPAAQSTDVVGPEPLSPIRDVFHGANDVPVGDADLPRVLARSRAERTLYQAAVEGQPDRSAPNVTVQVSPCLLPSKSRTGRRSTVTGRRSTGITERRCCR